MIGLCKLRQSWQNTMSSLSFHHIVKANFTVGLDTIDLVSFSFWLRRPIREGWATAGRAGIRRRQHVRQTNCFAGRGYDCTTAGLKFQFSGISGKRNPIFGRIFIVIYWTDDLDSLLVWRTAISVFLLASNYHKMSKLFLFNGSFDTYLRTATPSFSARTITCQFQFYRNLFLQ